MTAIQPQLKETAAEPGRRGRLGGLLLWVALYAAVIYLPFLGSARTLTSHEVMVTHAAQRMLIDGHWVVPHFASGLWLDKPPLVNWLTAASFVALGGFGEFAARLPAALSAIGLCLLVAALAHRFLSWRAALFAGLVQAICVYAYMQGRLGEIDMPFALLTAAAYAILAVHWSGPRLALPGWAAAGFHAIAGLTVLVKGAVAVILLGVTILCFCAVRRSWQPLRQVLWTPAVACFLLVAAPWHVAALVVAGEEALRQWGYNSVLRFFGLHHLGTSSPFYYFWTIPWLALPATIALLIGARHLVRQVRQPAAYFHKFLWCWFFADLLFLTLCLFKHKHYVIPLLPPLSIFCGELLDLHVARRGVPARRFYIAVFAGFALAYGLVSGVVLPRRDHRRVTAEFLRAATPAVPVGEKLYVVGLGQSSAYPYIVHDDCIYYDTAEDLRQTIRRRSGGPIWILTLRAYEELGAREGFAFEEVASEPERPKHPRPQTLILGRLSLSPTAPAPGSP